jgi:CRISPR-associated protein Csb2
MTVLELRFPAGRFHATPWGHHVNEGGVEWPPSPWRLLRSLVATWYLKARTEVTKETIRNLLNALAAQAPSFHLPNATNGHTRHYMPVIEGKNEKTTKIFDTFIQISPQNAVLIAWNFDLPPDQLAALRILAERLGYFGRAESLVEAVVREEITQIRPNAVPLAANEKVPSDKELVRLLSPVPSTEYDKWRIDFLAKTGSSPEASGKATKKTSTKKTKGLEVPPDLFSALEADTGTLQAAGWNLPPGAAWINYLRPSEAFAPAPRIRKASGKTKPTVARYAVVSSVSPRIIDAVSVANRVHDALCKWSDQGNGPASVFTGIGSDGKRLVDHRHAHIFCEANGPRDNITHLTVWADMGFDEQACLALRRLNKVWGHGGHDLRLALIGIGSADTFPDNKIFGVSKVWRSLTPFVPTRHAKTFRDGRPKMDEATGWQIGSAGHDFLRLLSLNPETAGAKIRQDKVISIGQTPNTRALRCLQFQTTRHDGGGSRGHGEGGSFTVSFPKPVAGPLAFGYGAHFGLGLFVPVLESGSEKPQCDSTL